MPEKKAVLVSWVAVNNDPFERERGPEQCYRLSKGHKIPGPTLTLLFDENSPYSGRISDAVLLFQNKEKRALYAVRETQSAIRELDRKISITTIPWEGQDPTDHRAIFAFLKIELPKIRQKFSGRDLVIHVSPGTPSMQTIWVLLAETGLVDSPFHVVKSYKKGEGPDGQVVAPVDVGLETFYKAFKSSRPIASPDVEGGIGWDPSRFQSDRMKLLFAEASQIAGLKIPVMILGERGTGKTSLASWIRSQSPYRQPKLDSGWPSIPCGQYSPETMRAELFGYKKGAFTGAVQDKEGLLVQADGDTLFMDEIGDISRDLQRLLIRAVEERTFHPLGDETTRHSDFRLLTATNLPMETLVKRLDPDFLDRISPIVLRLPSLREIPEELPWLWDAISQEAAIRSGAPKESSRLLHRYRDRLLKSMRSHPLPGNLRDLFRIAYRLLVALPGGDEKFALTYALKGDFSISEASDSRTESQRIALAFAQGESLDSLFGENGRIEFAALDRELKIYLAGELKRMAKLKGKAATDLCDRSERTIRSWGNWNKPGDASEG